MFEIREFCERVNKYKPDIFQRCKDRNKIRKTVESVDQLKPDELEFYQEQVQDYYNSYLEEDVWKAVVSESIKYSEPNMINAHLRYLMDPATPFWVFPCFMKSGKQFYNV